jgi:hypothetical protein
LTLKTVKINSTLYKKTYQKQTSFAKKIILQCPNCSLEPIKKLQTIGILLVIITKKDQLCAEGIDF